MEVGQDIPEKADLLVAEIVDNNLLGEDVLPLMEDARERLLKNDAVLLPRMVSSVGALVGGLVWTKYGQIFETMGLDLTTLNRFSPSQCGVSQGLSLDDAYSFPFEIFHFDFMRQKRFPEEERKMVVNSTRKGKIDGVLTWFKLDFGADIGFENRPPKLSAWQPQLHFFADSIDVEEGSPVEFVVKHNRKRIFIAQSS